jgi:daunosaminyl-N,N-dimethyltransferase/N-dimethyltransferase
MDPGGMFGTRAEYYDAIYHWKDYAAEARRLAAILEGEGVGAGARVLDAACGTGSHLAHLRERFDVAGFDRSDDMLAIARRKLPGVPLFLADMADFRVERPFDALLCLFSSIGYLDAAGLRSAAHAFARALRPGGALVLEPWLTREKLRVGNLTLQTFDGPDLKLARMVRHELDGDWSVLDFHWLALRHGGPGVEHFVDRHRLRLCPTPALLGALEDAGFAARLEPDGLMKDRGLVIARRR